MYDDTWWEKHAQFLTGDEKKDLDAFKHNCRFVARQVTNEGKILEIGCGKGLRLKYAIDFSLNSLIPYGADRDYANVAVAQEEVHPNFGGNFLVGDVSQMPVSARKHTHIIADPSAGKADLDRFLIRCLDNVEDGGSVICYATNMDEDVRRKLESFVRRTDAGIMQEGISPSPYTFALLEQGRFASWRASHIDCAAELTKPKRPYS